MVRGAGGCQELDRVSLKKVVPCLCPAARGSYPHGGAGRTPDRPTTAAEGVVCLRDKRVVYNGASVTRNQFLALVGWLLEDHVW